MPTPQPDPEALQETAWTILGIPHNAQAALARYARANNLGAPLTREFTFGSYQCQGYVLGIVYCPQGQWDQVQHIPW